MSRKRGFTLIELLVVVAIIALLIAILMPSLAKARNQAKIAACASNHRSVAMAMMMYGQENNNNLTPATFPGAYETRQVFAWNDGSGNAGNVYLGLLGPYLNGCDVGILPDGVPFTRRKALSCPDSGVVNTQSGTSNWATISYFGFFQQNETGSTPLKKTPVDNTAAIALTASDWHLGNIWGPASGWLGVDHHSATGENVSFFDGHVRFITNNEAAVRAVRSGGGTDTFLRAAFNAP